MLPRAVASVAAQTRLPDEIVVMIDHAGVGAAANRNAALGRVTSEYVAFLDDDDEFLPHHLEHCLALLEETGADLCYPWFEGINSFGIFGVPKPGLTVGQARAYGQPLSVPCVSPEGREWDETLADWLSWAGNFIPVTVVARTEAVRSVGGFEGLADQSVDQCDDYRCWMHLLEAGATFVHLPERTWRWNGHPGHTSGRRWTELVEPSGSFVKF